MAETPSLEIVTLFICHFVHLSLVSKKRSLFHMETIQQRAQHIMDQVEDLRNLFIETNPVLDIPCPDPNQMSSQRCVSIQKQLRQQVKVLSNVHGECEDARENLRTICDQLTEMIEVSEQHMAMPLCEVKRCGIYSQWVDLPSAVWLLIADFANSHNQWTRTIMTKPQDPTDMVQIDKVQIDTGCWCTAPWCAQVFTEGSQHSRNLYFLSDVKIYSDEYMVLWPGPTQITCHSSEFCALWMQLYHWHQDNRWPKINQQWLDVF